MVKFPVYQGINREFLLFLSIHFLPEAAYVTEMSIEFGIFGKFCLKITGNFQGFIREFI
jgi:hypothetical protein